MVGSIYLERNRVRGESIISNVSEVSGGAVPVRAGESTLKITLNEVVLVECWFTVMPSRGVRSASVVCRQVKTPDLGVL